jgi:FAD/FMN-containing dehydrogenase
VKSPRDSRRISRLGLGAGMGFLTLLVFFWRPAGYVVHALRNSSGAAAETPAGHTNDASRLNATPVTQIWEIPAETALAEKQLSELLARAKREHLPVSIAGARHSMGGQTIAPHGIVVDMRRFQRMDFDSERGLLRVQAGARWEAIIPYLDRFGRSVGVMQSDNSFSVGGSVSVNCHGWQFDAPPIASTVESLRLMKADGTIVRCSRSENAEFFSLVLGGYGLFGIILDLELRVVPNERYRLEQSRVPAVEALDHYTRCIQTRDGVRMVYARLNIIPESLFDEVLLNFFVKEEGEIPKLQADEMPLLQRLVFRGSAGSDYGKKMRWTAETRIQPFLGSGVASRNTLLNQSSRVLQNRTASSTDILQEYFVPEERAAEFVREMRRLVMASGCDLLNVTVRSVNRDEDTFLRYADQRMLAFVLLFNQPIAPVAESRTAALTRSLVDAALLCGGRYYLPYRLHASAQQFHRAYPQAARFFELKRLHDPEETFQNLFYRTYATH